MVDPRFVSPGVPGVIEESKGRADEGCIDFLIFMIQGHGDNMFSDLVKARWLKEMSQTPNMRFFARQFFTNEDLDSGPGKPAENHLLRIRGKEGAGRFEEATQKGMAASSLNGLLRARLLAKDRDWQIVTSPEHRFLIRINLVDFKGWQINQ